MSKKLQLDIPTPCHENWDKMTQIEKGRFCDSCQKQVVDFSSMSDREIALFFKKTSTGSVCGRFMQDQLNRDFEIPKKRIPWLKYFFQFLLPGFLISMKATAQGKVKVVEKEICSVPNLNSTNVKVLKLFSDSTTPTPRIVLGEIRSIPVEKEINKEIAFIKGQVIDDNNRPIANATIIVKGTKNGVITDANGMFSIKPKMKWKNIVLVVSFAGFETKELSIDNTSSSKTNIIILMPLQTILSGVVVVVGYPIRKLSKPLPLIEPIFKDTAFRHFRIFPNPAQSNSILNIEWKQTEAGDHMLQLYNQSGQLVFTKPIYIEEEARVLSIDLPIVLPGNYLLEMTHKTSGKSYTEKIIIQ